MLEQALTSVKNFDQAAAQEAKRRWDSIAKPLGSLGLLEDAIIRIAGISGDSQISLGKRCVAIFCADNGVVAEGVTQTGQEVTAIVTENFTIGAASVCAMARQIACDVIPVDIGVSRLVQGAGLRIHKIRAGTGNIARGAAMTRAQAEDALCYGIELVRELSAQGYRMIATGEMGIGNTTSSSAVTAALLALPPAQVTGRGAGLSPEGLSRKIWAVEQALAINHPNPTDAVDVLAKVGGLDIAGMAGVFLGGAIYRVPILIDGFISAVAALVAARICPQAAFAAVATHRSNEPAGGMLLKALGLPPLVTAGMCLGEGSGAVASIPLLDMALAVYREMSTFSEIKLACYQPL